MAIVPQIVITAIAKVILCFLALINLAIIIIALEPHIALPKAINIINSLFLNLKYLAILIVKYKANKTANNTIKKSKLETSEKKARLSFAPNKIIANCNICFSQKLVIVGLSWYLKKLPTEQPIIRTIKTGLIIEGLLEILAKIKLEDDNFRDK